LHIALGIFTYLLTLTHIQVADKTRQRRRDELISLQQRIGEGFAELQIGKEIDVLVVSAVDRSAILQPCQTIVYLL